MPPPVSVDSLLFMTLSSSCWASLLPSLSRSFLSSDCLLIFLQRPLSACSWSLQFMEYLRCAMLSLGILISLIFKTERHLSACRGRPPSLPPRIGGPFHLAEKV